MATALPTGHSQTFHRLTQSEFWWLLDRTCRAIDQRRLPGESAAATIWVAPKWLLLNFVALHNPVLDMDDAVCVLGNIVFMSDQDNRVALGVQTIEQRHDFKAGL